MDVSTRQLRYVNAGHNPPYLFRAHAPVGTGAIPGSVDAPAAQAASRDAGHEALGVAAVAVEELSTGGMVVGMFPDAEYEEGTVDLCSGDVLIAFTDGVPEAHNPAGDEFGEERLKQIVLGTLDRSAAEITARVGDALTEWIQDAERYDDLTVVVMKVRP